MGAPNTKCYTFESPTKAIPTDNFLFIPPDNPFDLKYRFSSKPIAAIIRSTWLYISPFL